MLHSPQQRAGLAMSFAEFVALMAMMMALTALSIDIMLPALPQIGAALGLEEPNHRQLVITFYLAGFAAGQPFYGPLSDRFGRRPPLFAGLAVFAAGTLLAAMAGDATVMFVARALQGFGAAAPRVIAIAIVRDRFAGRQMARVMSFVIMIFVILPILAPATGEGLLRAAPWQSIFVALLLAALVTLIWSAARLAESCPREARRPLSLAKLTRALRTLVTTSQTAGYALAFGFMFGILMSYINSAQQVFVDVYGLDGGGFPLVFGGVASTMIVSALANAHLVERLGMRRVSHVALLVFLLGCALMAAWGYPERPPLPVFCGFIALLFLCFGLIGPNFNALAMEPVGHIAGMASSLIGFYTTGAGALFGWLVGQAFDGSVRPLSVGFTVLAAATLVTVLVTERGRLAASHQPAVAEAPGPPHRS